MTPQQRADLERFAQHEMRRVVATTARLTGHRQDVDDAVQDAMLGYLSAPPTGPVDNLPGWITVVASRRLHDRHRRRTAEARAVRRLPRPVEGTEDVVAMLDVDVQRALASLPDRQRTICALFYLHDLSVEQVATRLGISPGSVKTHLHRARAALGAALAA